MYDISIYVCLCVYVCAYDRVTLLSKRIYNILIPNKYVDKNIIEKLVYKVILSNHIRP